MNGNIDPRVIKYLMRPERDRSDSPVDPSLVASMMDAASQFGMVDGRTADTSGVQKWAQGEQASQRDFQRRRDAREGKPPYFWALLNEPEHRREMLRDGWKSVGKVFLLAMVLDVVYQLIVLETVYPGEVVIVAFILAFIPYLLVRGPVTRLARRK